TPVLVAHTSTDTQGNFTVASIPPGTWDVRVKFPLAISSVQHGVAFSSGGLVTLSFGPQMLGDINGDDRVNILDFSVLRNQFGTSTGCAAASTAALPCADLDGNGTVNVQDFAILRNN